MFHLIANLSGPSQSTKKKKTRKAHTKLPLSQAPSVYNSRVSSILPTPSTIPRPKNVAFKDGIDSEPVYGPSRRLDFELEMGYYVSKPVPWGKQMPIEDAKQHIFGFVLLNDWSARDHQLFEMRPVSLSLRL